ncbi:MAG: helix-turn-helix transcriptional regulator [Streptosporangiaceae bacterium]
MASSNVEAARKALGQRMREIRVAKGYTCKGLAEKCGWHDGTKISKIEHGRQTPTADDIRVFCLHCDATDQVDDLIESLKIIEGMYVEWQGRQRNGMRRLQDSYVPLYLATRRFRIYQSLAVPGLLQTPGYAAALLTAVMAQQGVPDDLNAAVAARIDRQRILYEGTRTFSIVLEESVLRAGLGGVEVMAEQLDRLMTVMSLPRVSLGIIPANPLRRTWPTVPIWIYDDDRVLVELPSAEITVTQPRELAIYNETFTRHTEHALVGRPARALITEALEALS